ncbi:hypothetical protein GGR56DRAFT_262876 [Xylariaceae sp. FL0804]|nr:hypothetical protein GGR56DRAFT_262876 [Xylariaceae sp. FL0804]
MLRVGRASGFRLRLACRSSMHPVLRLHLGQHQGRRRYMGHRRLGFRLHCAVLRIGAAKCGAVCGTGCGAGQGAGDGTGDGAGQGTGHRTGHGTRHGRTRHGGVERRGGGFLNDAAKHNMRLAVRVASLVDLGNHVALAGAKVGDGDVGGLGRVQLDPQPLDGGVQPHDGRVGLVGQDGVAGAEAGPGGDHASHLGGRHDGVPAVGADVVGHDDQHVGRARPQVLRPARDPEGAGQHAGALEREAPDVLARDEAVEQRLQRGGAVAVALLPGLDVVADVLVLGVRVREVGAQGLEHLADLVAGGGALLDEAALRLGQLAVLGVLGGRGRGRVVVLGHDDAEVAAVGLDAGQGAELAARLLAGGAPQALRRVRLEGAVPVALDGVLVVLPRALVPPVAHGHDRVPLVPRVRLDGLLAVGPRGVQPFLGRRERHPGFSARQCQPVWSLGSA